MRKEARGGPELACARIGAAHHGIITRAEAMGAGLSPQTIYRWARRGRWVEIHPGVYRLAGAPETWLQGLAAACLWAGRGVAVSHRAAAALWGFPGFEPGPIELSTERSIRNLDGVTVHRVRWLPKTEVSSLSKLPVTSATRTLMDLGAIAAANKVERALEDALRRRLTDVPLLQLRLGAEGTHGRRGAGVLRALVRRKEAGYQPAESEFELKLKRLLANGGLPPVQQHSVHDGQKSFRLDFAYPDARVAIEADSKRYHFSAVDWERDLARRNALSRLGWLVLHVTWHALRSAPQGVLADVRSTLERARARP